MWSDAEGISSYCYVNRFCNSCSGAHQSLPTTPPLQASRNLCAATTRGAHGGDMDNVLGKYRIHRSIWFDHEGPLALPKRTTSWEDSEQHLICLDSATCWEVDNDFLHFQLLASSKGDWNEAVRPNRQSWQGCTAVRYVRIHDRRLQSQNILPWKYNTWQRGSPFGCTNHCSPSIAGWARLVVAHHSTPGITRWDGKFMEVPPLPSASPIEKCQSPQASWSIFTRHQKQFIDSSLSETVTISPSLACSNHQWRSHSSFRQVGLGCSDWMMGLVTLKFPMSLDHGLSDSDLKVWNPTLMGGWPSKTLTMVLQWVHGHTHHAVSSQTLNPAGPRTATLLQWGQLVTGPLQLMSAPAAFWCFSKSGFETCWN